MTVAAPIVRSSLRDQVLAELRQRLVSGDLKAGELYSAQALAAELGVSASPVREAMLTLVNQGLMEPVRNRGFRVIPPSDSDRRNVLQMRLWLEVPAMVQLASMKDLVVAGEQEYLALANDIVESARKGDLIGYLDSDRQFHLGLLGLLDNQILVDTVSNLRDQTRLFGLQALHESGQLIHSAEEHAGILAALVQGDTAKTEELMIRHLGHIGGDWAGDA
ncbi:GntR family transcriptional regulator [Arthrobacter crystallopoietes BAB-32]|uniref:GntR family transcriptional regulator n=1 Tax=Arthrobacter crystallopoietes BAB-32 TaxID=1246476 RepID=N1V0M8_9MICC|nr:GntR family transcriptional regulator [Arthrobacter crystallopoietes]EMY36211.1 GntR family transcriptional regulator [Arthrobacter crystallopoietes BAB-32]